MLTRRLQSDPDLPGVAAVIFDEIHERNLPTDLGLAFALEVAATVRPDLRLLAMSATAETSRLAAHLGGDEPAEVIVSEGRMHPIDIRWLPRGRRDRLEDAVVSAVQQAMRDDEGDLLVFLPGIGEILRTRSRLVDVLDPRLVDVRPLAGALSRADQDAALAPVTYGPPAGRAVDRHRRDVAHRRGCADRDRQRSRSRASLRRRHRHDASHDGVDESRLR